MLIAAKIIAIIHTAESLEDKECPKVSIIIQGKEVNEIV